MKQSTFLRGYPMKALRLLVLPLVFLALILGAVNPIPQIPPPMVDAAAGGDGDRVLVKFHDGVPASERTAAHRQVGGRPMDTIRQIEVEIVELPRGRGEAAVAAYGRNPRVQFAEPDALVLPEENPDDPYYSNGWHLAKIDAPGAWDLAKATGILIGICDTGIQHDHPDLAPVLRGDLAYNTADGSTNWSPVNSHGTKVAGAAAAATNNGTGVAGVAWGAMIIPVRITNRTDGAASLSAAAKCITYAADHGARAINLSYLMAGYSTIDAAGKYAQAKGALTTVAAGNQSEDPGWPNYAGFLAISNTNKADALHMNSNYGAFVDISAPGASIWTTRIDTIYGTFTGTSASAPVAAGVIALIFGANPGLSASQAASILLSSADDLGDPGWDPYFGHGRVNAARAVAMALDAAPSAGAITGTVEDSSDGTPLPGAKVSDGARTATTDDKGVYVITSVPEGTHTLTAEVTGYTTQSQSVTVAPGNTISAHFAMDESGDAPPDLNQSFWVESIAFRTTGPHLRVQVQVASNAGPVAGAAVGLKLSSSGGQTWFFSGATGGSGSVEFTVQKAPKGSYLATVERLSADGYAWDQIQGVTSAANTTK
jgi:hypothetical protein